MPNRSSKNKRSKDENILAKNLIDDIIEETESENSDKEEPQKNPAAVALGRLGGKKGGKARAKALSGERKTEIAKKAAEIRWAKYYEEKENED